MGLDDKIMRLDSILANSKLVKTAEKCFDDEKVEQWLLELKKDLTELLEK